MIRWQSCYTHAAPAEHVAVAMARGERTRRVVDFWCEGGNVMAVMETGGIPGQFEYEHDPQIWQFTPAELQARAGGRRLYPW